MIYGVVNEIQFVEGELQRTPIGYVSGLVNIIAYNNLNSPAMVIEQLVDQIPEGLDKITVD